MSGAGDKTSDAARRKSSSDISTRGAKHTAHRLQDPGRRPALPRSFEKYLRRSGGESWGADGDDGKAPAPDGGTGLKGHGPACEVRKSWRELELEMKEAKEPANSPAMWSKAIDAECEELPWIKAYRIAIQGSRARRACLTPGSDSHGRAAATFEDVVAFWQAKGW